VLAAPEVRMSFKVLPLAKQVRFGSIEATEPEVYLILGNSAGKEQTGLTPAMVNSLLETFVLTPSGTIIETLEGRDGKLHFLTPGSGKPEMTLENVRITLKGYENAGLTELQKNVASAPFELSAEDRSGSRIMKISTKGQVRPGVGVNGQLEVERFDFQRYRDLLPDTETKVAAGTGNLRFAYAIGSNPAGEQGKLKSIGTIHDGELSLQEFSLERQGEKTISGDRLGCYGLKADTMSRTITCETLELEKSDLPAAILSDGRSEGKNRKPTGWDLQVNNLAIRNSTLHVPLLKKLCQADGDLALQHLSLDAKGMTPDTDTTAPQGRADRAACRNTDSRAPAWPA